MRWSDDAILVDRGEISSDERMPEIIKQPDHAPRKSLSLEVNFALVLSRMIDSIQQDPVELRASVYELARIKLKEQFRDKDEAEINRLVGALETAIDGVEAFAQQEAPAANRLPSKRQPLAIDAQRAEVIAVQSALAADVTIFGASQDALPGMRAAMAGVERSVDKMPRGPFAAKARLSVVLVAIVAIGLTVAFWPRLRSGAQRSKAPDAVETVAAPTVSVPPASPARTPERPTIEARQEPDLPLPATFGIYAVSDHRLYELKPLVGKVPDPRVAMSTAITKPTEATLPDGRARFIVFRRDSAASAPDHADVRVVAKVRSNMGINPSGKANISPARDIWVIRNLSIPYKIGAIDDHPEMYLLQPDTADFVLPAGRYALVIKGQGFDFEVSGAITDPRQCLEQVNTLNGAFYSPCPEKPLAPVTR